MGRNHTKPQCTLMLLFITFTNLHLWLTTKKLYTLQLSYTVITHNLLNMYKSLAFSSMLRQPRCPYKKKSEAVNMTDSSLNLTDSSFTK